MVEPTMRHQYTVQTSNLRIRPNVCEWVLRNVDARVQSGHDDGTEAKTTTDKSLDSSLDSAFRDEGVENEH